MYILVLGLIKASIVSLYIRVFGNNITFKNVAMCVNLLIGMLTVILTALTVFTCWPIARFWDLDIKEGRCLDIKMLALANSGMAGGLDLIIILLPMSMLYRLKMSMRRKFTLSIVFSIGGAGVIVTGLRTRTLAIYGDSLDPTVDYIPLFHWTTAELAVAALCSCLPAIRTLVLSIWTRIRVQISYSEKAEVMAKSQLSSDGTTLSTDTTAKQLSLPDKADTVVVTRDSMGTESRRVSTVLGDRDNLYALHMRGLGADSKV